MASPDEFAHRKKKRDREVRNRIKNMSKEAMAAALARKKECNARAMLIVEQLIEPNVQQIWLLENLKHINQSHFQDIVEERAITRFCGYPLCDEELTNVPKKMYKISTKENKVYDITDRKNYCSNMCYKAGTYLKDQLYTSPLWLRDCEIPVEYKLLSGSKRSLGTGVGAEVDLGNTHPVKLDKQSEKETVNNFQSTPDTNKNIILKHYKPPGITARKNENLRPASCNEANKELECNRTELADDDLCNLKSKENTSLPPFSTSVKNQTNAGNDFPTCTLSEYEESTKVIKIDSEQDKKMIEPSKESQNLTSGNNCLVSVIDSFDSAENQNSSVLKKNEECSSDGTGVVLGQQNTVTAKQSETTNEVDNINQENLSRKVNEDNLKNNSCKKIKSIKYRSQIKKTRRNPDSEYPLTCVVSEIEQRVESWFTLESMVYLLGQVRLRELLKISGFKEDFPLPKSSKKQDYLIYLKCQEIYKKLNILELKDKEKEMPSKPLPCYEVLQKEAKELELKVKSFYRGDAKVTFAPTDDFNDDSKIGYEGSDVPALPLIDHHSVMATRRRIFIERLNKVLPDMLSALELSHFHLGCEIQELVSTFRLGATNICLRPPEWSLVAIMIIKLLTINNDELNFAYSKELTQRRLITYLLTYDLDGGYVDRFTSYLMDIERIADSLHAE